MSNKNNNEKKLFLKNLKAMFEYWKTKYYKLNGMYVQIYDFFEICFNTNAMDNHIFPYFEYMNSSYEYYDKQERENGQYTHIFKLNDTIHYHKIPNLYTDEEFSKLLKIFYTDINNIDILEIFEYWVHLPNLFNNVDETRTQIIKDLIEVRDMSDIKKNNRPYCIANKSHICKQTCGSRKYIEKIGYYLHDYEEVENLRNIKLNNEKYGNIGVVYESNIENACAIERFSHYTKRPCSNLDNYLTCICLLCKEFRIKIPNESVLIKRIVMSCIYQTSVQIQMKIYFKNTQYYRIDDICDIIGEYLISLR
jgi:hypothetical protein